MRQNYMYGHNDPLSWPQLFCSEYPHFAWIKGRSQGTPNDPFDILFIPLAPDIFLPSNKASLVHKLGKLRGKQFIKLKSTCTMIIQSSHCITNPPQLKQNILSHCEVLDMFLARMEQLPMSFERTYLTLRETQQVAQVLHALVDYVQIYKPRMDSQVPQDLIPITTDGLLRGAFVRDTTTLQRFH